MMRKQVIAVTIGVLLVLSVFSVLQFWQIKPAKADTYGSFGCETIGSGEWPLTSSDAAVSNFTSLVDANITQIVAYVKGTSGTVNIRAGIYDDNTGLERPYHLLNQSVTQGVGTSYAWVVFPVSYPIVTGTIYHFSIASDGNYTFKREATTPSDCNLDNSATGPTFNNPWVQYSNFQYQFSIYANYTITTGGGGLSGGGTVTTEEYIIVNSTATYEVNSTNYVISSGSDSVTIINNATSHVSPLHGSVFVYNGTYQLAGSLLMRSNTNMTLQNGVYFNHTDNSAIFTGTDIANSTVWAQTTNVTIKGAGINGYDGERAFLIDNVVNITIGAEQPNGLTILNSTSSVIESNDYFNNWVNNSLFQNLNVSGWALSSTYDLHGIILDGVQNSQLINLTVDARAGIHTRCCLVIGGDYEPTNNVNITGGIFENTYLDNAIYLLGGRTNCTNVILSNFTTLNSNLAHSSHSGIKIRPASNITVVGWNSTNDYYGMEMGTTYDDALNGFGGSWYNNISGTITAPYQCGLILYIDGSDTAQSLRYNTFNLTINNCTTTSAVWLANPEGDSTQISNNIFYINATGNNRQVVDFGGSTGIACNNTFFVEALQNGKAGYYDLDIDNTTAATNNTFNVYSTVGNPNGLYNWVNGTGSNYVYYPYSYSGPPPTLVTITITSPTNSTYTSSTIAVTLSATVSGSTLDKIWWNCKNGSSYIYGTNQTYTGSTSMTGIYSGSQYTFYAFANATDGTAEYKTVMFTETFVSGTVTITITNPTSIIYTVTTVPVQFTATSTGGTIHLRWWNILVGTSTWLTSYNLTYSGTTSVNNLANGDYMFYAWANDTSGNNGTSTETFTVNVASQGGGGGGGGGGGTQTTIPPANTNPMNNTTNGTGTPVSGFSIANWDWRHLTPVQGITVLAVIGVAGFVLVNQKTEKKKGKMKKSKWKSPSFWS